MSTHKYPYANGAGVNDLTLNPPKKNHTSQIDTSSEIVIKIVSDLCADLIHVLLPKVVTFICTALRL